MKRFLEKYNLRFNRSEIAGSLGDMGTFLPLAVGMVSRCGRNRFMENKNNQAYVYRLSIAARKGEKKQNVDKVMVQANAGIDGDAHSQSHRPVSLLPFESFEKVRHPDLDINPGDFAENITTIGVDFRQLKIGTRVLIGNSVDIEVIQIGKECHHGCIIRETVGDCIMPREGVFGKVLAGGEIKEGDEVKVVA